MTSLLLNDLYALTMARAHDQHSPDAVGTAVFFFREAPFGGGHVVTSGIETWLDSLETMRFDEGDLEYLSGLDLFDSAFLKRLRSLRVDVDVDAVAEGEVVLPGCPVVRLRGSLLQLQLLMGSLSAHLNPASLVATKALRILRATADRSFVELGVRRAHGVEGSIYASRAAYVGGAVATSNVLAGRRFGIPVVGTMAHSFVQAFADERTAFEAHAATYPNRCVLLLDTYDTLRSGLPAAIPVLKAMVRAGHRGTGVRFDSGDLSTLAMEVRRVLDANGLQDVAIYASGDLDEWSIDGLVRGGAPINVFGVGTQLVTGSPAAAASGVCKLVEVGPPGAARPCMKISDSPGKRSWPGSTEVVRVTSEGTHVMDVLCGEAETMQVERELAADSRDTVERLLSPRARGGRLVAARATLDDARHRCAQAARMLPEATLRLDATAPPRLRVSEGLVRLQERIHRRVLGASPLSIEGKFQ